MDEDNLLYVTWFAGGLGIIDINDPANPKERATSFRNRAAAWPRR